MFLIFVFHICFGRPIAVFAHDFNAQTHTSVTRLLLPLSFFLALISKYIRKSLAKLIKIFSQRKKSTDTIGVFGNFEIFIIFSKSFCVGRDCKRGLKSTALASSVTKKAHRRHSAYIQTQTQIPTQALVYKHKVDVCFFSFGWIEIALCELWLPTFKVKHILHLCDGIPCLVPLFNIHVFVYSFKNFPGKKYYAVFFISAVECLALQMSLIENWNRQKVLFSYISDQRQNISPC